MRSIIRGGSDSLSSCGITSDLAAVVCSLVEWLVVSSRGLGRGAFQAVRPELVEGGGRHSRESGNPVKTNTAGGSPAASHFSCLAKKSNQKKSPPVCRRYAVPCVARLVRRLRNSRYALRQSSPKTPDQPPLLGGAQGKESQKRKTDIAGVARHVCFVGCARRNIFPI